jgi:hypothetical protein
VFIVFFLLPDLSEFSEFFFYFDPNEEDPETPITDIIDYLCLIAWGIFLFFTPSGYISNQYLNNSNTNNHAETTQSSDKATQSSDKLSDTYYWGSITVKFVNFNLKEYAYITKALSTQLPKRNELRTIHLEKSPSDLYINGVLSKSSYVNDEFVNEIIQSTYQ